MFTGKDVKQITHGVKPNETTEAIVYTRVYLDFDETDEKEEFKRYNGIGDNKKVITLSDGTEFVGIRPKQNFSAQDPTSLFQSAIDYLEAQTKEHVSPWSEDKKIEAKVFKNIDGTVIDNIPNVGWLQLLKLASAQNDLLVRAEIQDEFGLAKPKDPKKKREADAKDMIAKQAQKGKKITTEQAYAQLRKAEIQDYMDFDEMSLEDATKKVNEDWGIKTEVSSPAVA